MTHRLPRVARPSGAAKPSVFLVDDHPALLDRVSSLLSEDFEVTGAFTDSRQAIDAAAAASPDVIVLDINMPDLDGFQTMRALEQAGSQAPVVILTLLQGEEYVAEAFRYGARGYVLKRQLVDDLGSAIDQVLHGRLFAPSLTSLFQLAGSGRGTAHAMQLYGDTPSFLDGAAAFLDLALRRGDATAVVATEDVRDGLRGRLRDRGWDASGHYRCLLLDTSDVLNRFIRDGLPDAALLAEVVTELEEFRLVVGGSVSRLTVFGTMVTSLIASGNATAAIELERLWNAFTNKRPFFTLCGYATPCFNDATGELWSRACAEHWAVSHANDV